MPEKLRPRKWRNAAERRAFEYAIARTPLHPGSHRLEDLGTPYGGWMIPTDLVEPGWICYSVGAGADVSFEQALLQRWRLRIRCIEPVADFVRLAEAQIGAEEEVTVHQVAVSVADGPVRMQQTHHPGAQSVSASGLYLSDSYVEVPGRTLPSLMRELGDPRIDLLKLDIEGFEYDVMPTVDLRELGVSVFATQLHQNGGIRGARRLIAALAEQGYRATAIRDVIKMTFVRSELTPSG